MTVNLSMGARIRSVEPCWARAEDQSFDFKEGGVEVEWLVAEEIIVLETECEMA